MFLAKTRGVSVVWVAGPRWDRQSRCKTKYRTNRIFPLLPKNEKGVANCGKRGEYLSLQVVNQSIGDFTELSKLQSVAVPRFTTIFCRPVALHIVHSIFPYFIQSTNLISTDCLRLQMSGLSQPGHLNMENMQSMMEMTPFPCFSAEPGDEFQGDQEWYGLCVAESMVTNQLQLIEFKGLQSPTSTARSHNLYHYLQKKKNH